MIAALAGFGVVLIAAMFIALRRLLAGEVFFSFGGLPRNGDLLARVEALTAMEWAVRTHRPLSQALWSIIPEVSRRQKLKLRKVAAALEEGSELGAACASAPRIFPGPLRALLTKAQLHGALDRVIPAVAARGRAERTTLTWAMAAFVLPLMAALVAAMPTGRAASNLREIAYSRGMPSPLAVDLAEQATTMAAVWPWALLLLLWTLALFRRWRVGRTVQRACGEWIPGIGGIVRARWLADAGDLIAALMDAGVPAERALAAAEGLECTGRQRAALVAAKSALAEGVPLAEALEARLPRWARWRVRLLAAAGRPAEAFRALSAEASRRASLGLMRLTRGIYPVTLVLLAVAAAAWLRHLVPLSAELTYPMLIEEGLVR
jgi:type II secretory pathway component PulF